MLRAGGAHPPPTPSPSPWPPPPPPPPNHIFLNTALGYCTWLGYWDCVPWCMAGTQTAGTCMAGMLSWYRVPWCMAGQGRIQDFRKRGCYKPYPHVGVVEVLYCNILLFLPPPIMHRQPRTTGSQVNLESPGFESQIYYQSQSGRDHPHRPPPPLWIQPCTFISFCSRHHQE